MSVESLPRAGLIEDGAYLYPVRVYYEDTDAGGIVYHANYLRFAERARSEMLRRLGIEQGAMRARDGVMFAVRRCTVDFLAPARLDDDLTVATRLVGVGAATMDILQDVRLGDRELVRLKLLIACVGPAGRPARIPKPLRAALEPLSATHLVTKEEHAR